MTNINEEKTYIIEDIIGKEIVSEIIKKHKEALSRDHMIETVCLMSFDSGVQEGIKRLEACINR